MKAVPWYKPAIWGAVIGATAVMVVGFSWGGWTLGSTAEGLARQRAESAVVAVLTPFCVQNFRRQKDAAKKLAELQAADLWAQREFIEKGGWATMPGGKEPAQGVASACAEELVKN